jgi:nicotinamidase-related amidase
MKVCLFIIDPQEDFCNSKGSLCVTGADEDMKRVAAMIMKNKDKIDDIQLTLDSHHLVHVAHPISWIDRNGNHPSIKDFYAGKPTIITLSECDAEYDDDGKLLNGNPNWKATNPKFRKRFVEYVRALDKSKRKYPLIVWPPHCLIGTPGACIYAPLNEAISVWESDFAVAGKTTKGSNIFVEHYSALKAEVEDPKDPGTKLNTRPGSLLHILKGYDLILGCGEALSHCFKSTIEDIAEEFSEEQVKKITYLEDASSPVTDFEKPSEDFINTMVKKGMKIARTTNCF